MDCPYCESFRTGGHGKTSSGEKRWKCKNCNKTFTKLSQEGYPRTVFPFQFVSFILYMCKNGNASLGEIARYANKLLMLFKYPFNKKTVSRTTIYNWKKFHGEDYSKKVSQQEAVAFFRELLVQAHPELIKESIFENIEVQMPFYELKPRFVNHETVKKKFSERDMVFQVLIEIMGEEYVIKLIKKNDKLFNKILKMLRGKIEPEGLEKEINEYDKLLWKIVTFISPRKVKLEGMISIVKDKKYYPI